MYHSGHTIRWLLGTEDGSFLSNHKLILRLLTSSLAEALWKLMGTYQLGCLGSERSKMGFTVENVTCLQVKAL